MTLKLMAGPIKQWNLISSDERPSTEIPEGSILHYIDTGELYIFHDGTWEPDVRLQYALTQALEV